MAGALDSFTAGTANRLGALDQFAQGVRLDPAVTAQMDADQAASLSEFGKALRRSAYSTSAAGQAFVGQMAEPFAPNFARTQIAEAVNTLRNIPQRLAPRVEKWSDIQSVEDFGDKLASSLGEGIPSTLTALGAGLATRGLGARFGLSPTATGFLGGTVAGVPFEGGETALQLQMDPQAMANTTPAERAALTLGRGAANAALESVVPNLMMAPRLMGDAMRVGPGLGNATRNIALAGAQGGVGEFGTGFAQDVTGQVAMNLAKDTSGIDLRQAAEAGLTEAVGGTAFGSAVGGVQALANNVGQSQPAPAAERSNTQSATDSFIGRLRSMTENPEQFGADVRNMTLEALDAASSKSGDLATDARKAVGRGIDAAATGVGKLKTELDRFVINNVSPENRDWYIDQTSRLGSMTAGEYQIFKEALQAETGKEFREGLGISARLAADKAVEGGKKTWDWVSRVYDGVRGAEKDSGTAKQSLEIKRYSINEQRDLRDRIAAVDPKLGDMLNQGTEAERRQLSNILLSAVDNPSYFQNADQSKVKQSILDGWKKATGTDLPQVLQAVREGKRNAEVSALTSDTLDQFMYQRGIPQEKKGLLQSLANKQTYAELSPSEKRLMTTLAKKDPVELGARREFLANAAHRKPYAELTRAQKKQFDRLTGADMNAKDRGETYFTELVRSVDRRLQQVESQQPMAGDGNAARISENMIYDTEGTAPGSDEVVIDPETGQRLDVERTESTPFNLQTYREVLVHDKFSRRKDTTIPVQLSSDQLTSKQIASLFGKKTGDTKNPTFAGLSEQDLAKIQDGKPVTLSINPMSLQALTGTEGFREQFRGDLAEYDESVDDNVRAGRNLLSALATLNDRGIEINPEDIGLPPGPPIKINAKVDMSALSDDLLIRQKGSGKTAQQYRLSDFKRDSTTPSPANEEAAARAAAADELAAIREAYTAGDLSREQIDTLVEYYRNDTNEAGAQEILGLLNREPVDESLRDAQATRIEDAAEAIERRAEEFDQNKFGRGDLTVDALEEEFKAAKVAPFERANTERVARDVRKAKNEGNQIPARSKSKKGSRAERVAARRERLARQKAESGEAETVAVTRATAPAQTTTPGTPEQRAAAVERSEQRAAAEAKGREKKEAEAQANTAPAEATPETPQQISSKKAREAIEAAKTVEELESIKPRIDNTPTLPKGIKQILTGMVQRKIEQLLAKNQLTIRNANALIKEWTAKYAPDAKVRVEFFEGKDGDAAGEARRLRSGAYLIRINTNTRDIRRMTTLAHEFGHVLQMHAFDTADAATQAAVRASYERDLAEFQRNRSTLRELGRRFLNPAVTPRTESSSQADKPGSGKRYAETRDARRNDGYTLSFEEWFANQFAKHVLADHAAGKSSDVEARFWSKVIKTAKQFWDDVISKLQPNTEFKDWVTGLVASNTAKAVEQAAQEKNAAINADRQRFVSAVEKLVGKRISIIFDQQLTEGVAAEYESRDAALERVREERRAALAELKKKPENRVSKATDAELHALVKQTEDTERSILDDKAALGVIRVAAGMESKAGLAEHEAFHGAFAFFFNKDERKALGTAFSQGLVAKRLKDYFKDHPDVINAIERDPEEAAAYGFQVWMHDPDALKLGERVNTLFERFKQFFRTLFGLMTPEQRALLILNDLKTGRRAERGTSPLAIELDKNRPWSERAQKYARDVGGFIMSGYDMLLTGTYQRLIDKENPAITQIAKLGYQATGEEGKGGMVQRTMNQVRRFQNEAMEIFNGLTDAEKLELHNAKIFDQEPTDPKLKDRWQRLNRVYKELYDYQVAAGVSLKNAGVESNYYPLTWDPEKVVADKKAFLAMLEKYKDQLETARKTPEEIWEGITAYIERGEDLVNVMGRDNEPISEHTRTRTLAFISREDRRPFMTDDPIHTTARYINQAVRQAEYVRSFGENGSKLEKLKTEAQKTYGATVDDIALVNDYIDGLLGNKEVGMSRELKDLYGGLIVYQNIRLLPFSLFSSLIDPLGIAVRSNNIGDAFKTFGYSVKNIFRDFKANHTRDEWEALAEDWGIIESAGTVANVDRLYTGITLRGTTKKINDAFFKYNLLNGWVRNNHIMAVAAAQRFMYRASQGFFKGKGQNERYLQELGISKDDVIYSADRGRILLRKDELMAAGKSEAEATEIEQRLQQATEKFVRQSLLNPNTAELPNWASNPYLAPIFHLKQFIWAFNSTILNRIKHETENANYAPILLAAAYVPAIIAADFLRDMVSNMGEEPEWKKDWTAWDYFVNGVERSGLTGTGAIFTAAHEDIMRGGSGLESFSGPSIEQIKKLAAAASADDGGGDMYHWLVKALPANAVYDQALLE